MGTVHMIVCISCLGSCLISAQSEMDDPDAALYPRVPGFFGSFLRFPFLLFPDDIFSSSWRSPVPDLHRINDGPLFPGVDVHCDESQITVFVEKWFNGGVLGGAQVQLGDGCYSNGEGPHQLIFTYGSDECGTTHEVHKDWDVLSNTVYLRLQSSAFTWGSPSAVHISCVTNRSDYPSSLVSDALRENGRSFSMKLMNPSWTSAVESTIFKRAQVVRLQVSATTRRGERLYVQSCFISPSPEPHAGPKRAIILNKGCASPLDSSHMTAQFVDSDREDVVNLAVTTSYIPAEFYFHCNVLVSNHSATSGSKSCNYNSTQSRWEDLSGNADVCKCCRSRCKGLSLKHLPRDAKATVSTGPLLMDHDMDSGFSVSDSLQSNPADTVDTIFSGVSFSDPSQVFPSEGVLNQGRVIRLTLWSPGDAERHTPEPEDGWTTELEQSDMGWNPPVDPPPLSPEQQVLLKAPTGGAEQGGAEQGGAEQGGARTWDANALTLFDGQPVPPHLEEAAVEEESQRKRRLNTLEAPPLPGGIHIGDMEELEQKQTEERHDVQPVIRSKVQFSRGVDGSRAWSYEQEVMQEGEGRGGSRHLGTRGCKTGGLLATFLDLLRRMDGAE